MLKLKRFEGDHFYVMPKDPENQTPLMKLTVAAIDDEGDYVIINISGTESDRQITLYDEVEINEKLTIYFDGIYIFRGRLSVTVGFDTSDRVIRGELLGSESSQRVTKRTINHR